MTTRTRVFSSTRRGLTIPTALALARHRASTSSAQGERARPVIYSPLTLPLVSDRRLWNPEASYTPQGRVIPVVYASARRVSRVIPVSRPISRSRPTPGHPLLYPGWQVAFPKAVSICVRRHVRRRVIFARGHAGGPVRRPRRGPYSNYSCR